MSSEIKAIETRYKGYRFRSRTEARWAVLFDRLGLKYEYECEGFRLPSGECYLPDFYIPDLRATFEVKPSLQHGLSDPKLREFATSADGRVYLIAGAPAGHETAHFFDLNMRPGEAIPKYLAGCPICSKWSLVPEQENSFEWMTCGCAGSAWQIEKSIRLSEWALSYGVGMTYVRVNVRDCVLDSLRLYAQVRDDLHVIESAFEAAKSARFEHGETPEVVK